MTVNLNIRFSQKKRFCSEGSGGSEKVQIIREVDNRDQIRGTVGLVSFIISWLNRNKQNW